MTTLIRNLLFVCAFGWSGTAFGQECTANCTAGGTYEEDGVVCYCRGLGTPTLKLSTGAGAAWGGITGTLSSQTDLNSALSGKSATGHGHAPGDVTGTAVVTGDSRLTDARTPTTHSHAPSDTTGTAVITNDARLSDARTPTSHSHAPGEVTGTAVVTNDSRLSDARTPTAHNQAESTLTFTDIVTGNVSTTAHGFTPKLPNVATQFFNGVGGWTVPTGTGGPTTLVSTSTQSDAVIAIYTAITGLSFTPAASTNYLIDCYIVYTSTAATTGINFAWDTPASPTMILMVGNTKTVATGANEGFSQNTDNVGTATSAAVITVQNLAVLNTLFRNGLNSTTMSLGFTPEIANSVSVIAGSVCQYRSF